MREYYAYFIQQRRSDQSALLRGGRLFQQFIVDAFTCIEQERLDFIKRNQKALRSEIYSGIRDAFFRGDTESNNIGKHVILPASYTGSPRYMMEHYHDAMAICRVFGHPDLFVTFTCNPAWSEISDMLAVMDGQTAENRPDIVARVFKFKVDMLSKYIKNGKYFGPISAFLYTVEFQIRGLPRIHCLIWLATSQKPLTIAQIDNFICAELPDPEVDLQCSKLVIKFMIHGPCGVLNEKSPCMRKGKCSKHFPKKFRDETYMDEKGFGIYKRRDNGMYVEKMYISKGSDRVRAVLENGSDATGEKTAPRDEVKNYLDCRYISPCEAAWRIFEFPIQHREPAVEKLVVHLPNMNSVYFNEHVGIRSLYYNANNRKTMLTEWFSINARFEEARELTYSEFPSKWVWNSRDKIWELRKRGRSIGRVTFVHPNAGELYYLRMLLNIVKGPRSFEEIRTVGEIQYPTFQATCMAYGLLGDDKEWIQVLDESTAWASSQQLRRLFVILLIFCDVGDPVRLFNRFWRTFADDVEYNMRHIFGIAYTTIPDELLKNHVLFELEKLLNRNGNSLPDYNLPLPAGSIFANSANKLIVEELSFDPFDLKIKHESMVNTLNNEQKTIHDDIVNSVESGDGRLFFIYGHGGTGKTYLYKTIIYRFRSEGKIVLVVASSGIASLLLPGGRTAHSRFKIPINLDGYSSCEIKRGTQLSELIKQTALVIWDEAPMNHHHCFEAIDRSFRDILATSCENFKNLPFGGKTFVLGGDFRQILPVVPQGTKEDVLNASVTKSYLWELFNVYKLNINMRVNESTTVSDFLPDCSFSQWLLSIGDGRYMSRQIELFDEENNWINIPSKFIITYDDNPIESIINYVYTEFKESYMHPTYLQERAIVCPRNEVVEIINSAVLDLVPEQDHVYYSYDSICNNSSNLEELLLLYPVEFLNTLQFNGFPQHALKLKLNTPVMLLRNLNPSVGLCNGTRLLIIQLGVRVIEAQIMTGSFAGDRVFIPRIVLSATDKKWPFILKRRQFPLRVCYAMTINKSQGQTLNKIGIYLDNPVFTHGQLYVALSRVTNENGIGLLIKKNDKDAEGIYLNYTKNVVYSEILQDL
ncbi:uncharacterized protein LOC126664257 [Mercurialis annua]|uniref:uncharacterized protein LOC126664257 n=1 Tax=Mercurialis annua TaxID=3986 RepID=UPI00215F4500|nr:uncharacterized protein LOC126664257 [Mercurialis annua]